MTADEEHVKKVKETRAAREAAQALVGRHVRVWWAGDNVWYAGSIASFDNVSKKHTVSYEDGDLRAHNLLEAGVQPANFQTLQRLSRAPLPADSIARKSLRAFSLAPQHAGMCAPPLSLLALASLTVCCPSVFLCSSVAGVETWELH